MNSRIMLLCLSVTMSSACCGAEPEPDEHASAATPIVKGPTGRPLSLAMQRAYRDWPAADDRDNEFFTNFKYSRLTGIGKDPYVSRRDPSKVIKHDGKYYVWYTRRETVSHPVGIEHGTDKFPALDWDLADIHYATSTNGFDWDEQGVAVRRAPQGQYGDRSLTTTDILIHQGKYYLYYQTFTGPFRGDLGDRCDVSLAWADSPDGPWTKAGDPVVPLGGEDEWDGGAIHDPFAVIYRGKVWLFYKGEPLRGGSDKGLTRAQGVALADKPEGPFVKHELNPLLNSGHETCVFPWQAGLVALVTVDGPEKNTVQYAPNGMDFKPVASIVVPPYAPGPYCPDVFEDNGNGMGIKWGLAHISEVERERGYRGLLTRRSFLVRFDCDLHRDYDNAYFKNNWDQVGKYSEETFFHTRTIMDPKEKQKAIQAAEKE